MKHTARVSLMLSILVFSANICGNVDDLDARRGKITSNIDHSFKTDKKRSQARARGKSDKKRRFIH